MRTPDVDRSAQTTPPAKRRPVSPQPQRAPERSGTPAAGGPLGRDAVLALQRSAGNAATTQVVQRAGPVDNIATLDELLDRWNTPENEVLDLLGRMTAAEKRTVLAGYRQQLAGTLDFDEMHRAVVVLGAELPVQLDWLQQAATLTSAISYEEIADLVRAAPQAQRDMLRNQRWRSFFVSVCTNSTIVTAVNDLAFDLPTRLEWVSTEASALLSVGLTDLKPMLTAASAADRATVATDAWRPFWVDVCTNQSMSELVDLLIPDSLVQRLEWMAAEGSTLALVRAKVGACGDATQKLALFGNATVRTMMVELCNDAEMAQFALDLGGGWAQWREWATAEGTPLRDLARAAVARGLVTDAIVVGFVGVTGSAVGALTYLRTLQDANLAPLRGEPLVRDVIVDAFGGDAAPVLRALDGEIASGEQEVSNRETLLTGLTSSPFVGMDFASDHRFSLSYRRDRVDVGVGVELEAADDRAGTLLPGAVTTWQSNILAAWDNKFQLQNTERTIPIRFQVNLGSGPNHVNVHSGRWAWPNLNAGNWFVPDPVNVPEQAAAVSQAPVHEFGHLIGNLDEYKVGAAHYIAVTGQNPVGDPNTIPETDSAGTTRYTNSLSVMGQGTSVLGRHMTSILSWVNTNRRSGEPPFTVV